MILFRFFFIHFFFFVGFVVLLNIDFLWLAIIQIIYSFVWKLRLKLRPVNREVYRNFQILFFSQIILALIMEEFFYKLYSIFRAFEKKYLFDLLVWGDHCYYFWLLAVFLNQFCQFMRVIWSLVLFLGGIFKKYFFSYLCQGISPKMPFFILNCLFLVILLIILWRILLSKFQNSRKVIQNVYF